jgi:putative Holliday junction resolvase
MSLDGPVMALDYGTRRIGIAISDAEACFAFPAGHLASRGRERDLEALRALVVERGVRRIVVGLPIHLDGRRGETAIAAEKFANEVAKTTSLPVEMLDERWTSRQAERALAETRPARSRRRERGDVDAAAATLLLQNYLSRAHAASEAAR